MSNDDIPPDEGPVTDPEELERVMKLAGADPALRGPLMRMLLAARLWVYVPPHPELVGEHVRDVREGFTWCTYRDKDGDFAAVFTSLRAAKDEMRSLRTMREKPGLVELPARVLFGFLNDRRTTVRVMAFNGATIKLPPEMFGPLLAGEMTEDQPPPPSGATMLLTPLAPEDVPSKLRQAIRVFCTQRQGALAVYVCNPADDATGAVNELDLRITLRLRDNPGYFYNDFQMMVQKMTPKPYEAFVGVLPPENEEDLAFFQRCTPVWPIV
jgi:hypothetical protein